MFLEQAFGNYDAIFIMQSLVHWYLLQEQLPYVCSGAHSEPRKVVSIVVTTNLSQTYQNACSSVNVGAFQ
jgi:hypothetical protein